MFGELREGEGDDFRKGWEGGGRGMEEPSDLSAAATAHCEQTL